MQQLLQDVQFRYRIYNSDLEPPDHDVDFYCSCRSCGYKRRKTARYGVQDLWSRAVMYPGEKAYNDNTLTLSWRNPYRFGVVSPYGPFAGSYGGGSASFGQFSTGSWAGMRPIPRYHTQAIQQTIRLNDSLNHQAQRDVDAREPSKSIWDDEVASMQLGHEKQQAGAEPVPSNQTSKFSRRAKDFLHIKSSEQKAIEEAQILKDSIIAEELGRWPDEMWRAIVAMYQEKMGMAGKIKYLRARRPIQYLHLLRAGYFEPIPVSWADRASNPLKFTVDAAAGQSLATPDDFLSPSSTFTLEEPYFSIKFFTEMCVIARMERYYPFLAGIRGHRRRTIILGPKSPRGIIWHSHEARFYLSNEYGPGPNGLSR